MSRHPDIVDTAETTTGEVVEVFFSDLERWKRVQDLLVQRDVSVPLEHRWSWLRDIAGTGHWFVVLRSADGGVRAALPALRHSTRSLPGHYRLRVTHLGCGARVAEVATLLGALKSLVRSRPELLDVNVEVFATDRDLRVGIEEVAQSLGFLPARPSRRYHRTARLDLLGNEDELLASFSGECRRGIRDPAKKGYRVEAIADARWVPRMNQLWHETFARTNMTPPERSWAPRIAYARNHPDLFRIVGTFGPGYPETESLVAFSCGMNNGDHAVYSDGASTRHLDTTVSVSYAALWDLIRWAKASGCSWLDLGGISEGTHGDSHDPRGGIADFKRRFTQDVIEVGREWSYRTSSVRSWLWQAIRESASTVRNFIRRR